MAVEGYASPSTNGAGFDSASVAVAVDGERWGNRLLWGDSQRRVCAVSGQPWVSESGPPGSTLNCNTLTAGNHTITVTATAANSSGSTAMAVAVATVNVSTSSAVYYEIVGKNSGKVLEVQGCVGCERLRGIQQWNYLGGANQKWQLVPVGTQYLL